MWWWIAGGVFVVVAYFVVTGAVAAHIVEREQAHWGRWH